MKLDGKRFLITGAASLVGSHIAEQLLAAGAGEIVLFDNFSLGSQDAVRFLLDDSRIRFVRGDITRIDDLMSHMNEVDGVFAVAGYLTLPMSQNPALGLDVNISGHLNVLQACRFAKVKKVIFSSTIGVYGTGRPGVVDEMQAFNYAGLQPVAALYGASKVVGENLCRLFSERYGVASISLRYGSVYGERQHFRGVNSNIILETYNRIRSGQRPVVEGDGSTANYYVYVRDAARANILSMASDVSGESLNILDPAEMSAERIVKTVLRAANSDLSIEYLPPSNKAAFKFEPGLAFDVSKSERMIGWRPQFTMEDGIKRLIAWVDQSHPQLARPS